MIGFCGAGLGGSPSANTDSVFYEGLGAHTRNYEWYSAITKCCAVGVVCAALTAQHAGVAQFIAVALIMPVLWLLDCRYRAKAQVFEWVYRSTVPIQHLGALNLAAPGAKAPPPKTFAFNRIDGAYYAALAILATLVLVP